MESEAEGDRLEEKTDKAETLRQLQLVGLQPGMTALDAGAGTGAVARVMAEIVGAEGEVTAFDASEKRMLQGERLARDAGIKNMHFQAGDIYSPPFQEGQFDFVWSRFVFEYLSDPELAMEKLVSLVKPGGRLVVGDLDGNAVFHAGMEPDLEKKLHKVIDAFQDAFDPYAGRKLFGHFHKNKLQDIQVHCMPYHLYAGSLPDSEMSNWQGKLDTICPYGIKALGGEDEYVRFSEEFMAFLRRPETLTYSTLFLVSGVRL